jgi:hypothetical protein
MVMSKPFYQKEVETSRKWISGRLLQRIVQLAPVQEPGNKMGREDVVRSGARSLTTCPRRLMRYQMLRLLAIVTNAGVFRSGTAWTIDRRLNLLSTDQRSWRGTATPVRCEKM